MAGRRRRRNTSFSRRSHCGIPAALVLWPPIPGPAQARLEQEARLEFALLRLLSLNHATVVLELAAVASRTLATNFDHRVELGHWIGITGDDGIPARALGSRPDRQPAPVRDFSYASPAAALPAATFEQQPQLAVLFTARDEPADWLRAGQALQRVLLTARAIWPRKPPWTSFSGGCRCRPATLRPLASASDWLRVTVTGKRSC